MDQTSINNNILLPKVTLHSLAPSSVKSDLGSIYTPSDYSQFLVSWAIRSPNDVVMDLGVGGGSFVFTGFDRLFELGADSISAQLQVYGSEIEKSSFDNFIQLAKERALNFPNITNENFFDIKFPDVDAIIGNPPYVRRMNIRSTDAVRERVLKENQLVSKNGLSRLTDLYVYFLLYAIPKLKPGGRLAVITAESWLNVSYGEVFKEYLLRECDIEYLISLDRRVFDDAQVKTVMLLARKKTGIQETKSFDFLELKMGFLLRKSTILLSRQ